MQSKKKKLRREKIHPYPSAGGRMGKRVRHVARADSGTRPSRPEVPPSTESSGRRAAKAALGRQSGGGEEGKGGARPRRQAPAEEWGPCHV